MILEKSDRRYYTDDPENETVLDTTHLILPSGNQCWVTPVSRRTPRNTRRVAFMTDWRTRPSEEDTQAIVQFVNEFLPSDNPVAMQGGSTDSKEVVRAANLTLADDGGMKQ